MAERPTKLPADRDASLESARKRPHPDMDFQTAIKRAKQFYREQIARPPLTSTDASKRPSPAGIPGLGNLSNGDRATKSETTQGGLDGTKDEKQERGYKLEGRSASNQQAAVDTYTGPTAGIDGGSESRSSVAHGARRDAKQGSYRPFAPPKKPPRKGRRPVDNEIETIETRTTTNPASFYDNVDMRAKYNRGDLIAVSNINGLIKNCQKTKERYGNADPRDFANIRKRLHQMEFYDFLSPVIIKKSKVLDDDAGLPQIFSDPGGVDFPWDIKADALTLYLRWLKGVLDPHLLRGIDTERKGTGAKHTGHKLRKDYLGIVSCSVWGENNLQNGQWWPLQICAKRDGGHGEIEGGIHGQTGKGAFSVVLSNGGYDDRDEGDRIFYCGTSGSGGEPSAGTSRLLETHRFYKSGDPHPVRVIRAAKLPKENRYRPNKGLRYDGLYDVISYEVLHAETAMHRFELKRRPGQDPIRFLGVEARPTDEEVAEFVKIRGLLGLT
ncbi:hypothetical protein GP486_005960 [Trichoglossum hirsutum]|uniref:YDG domain-containing protein n=1 Tax=Trichoglossum hirsutum TaxID=265104 RepID=A0A9P8L8B6_9PEZI|nr:hypothetical protein GP486_005960 [Trichoglossum hirsutum]